MGNFSYIGVPPSVEPVIDDAVTVTDKTWSSTKIDTEVAAAGAATNTTPAPQLSHASVSGNEGTSVNVTIQNYQATGINYTVNSADETFVTVSRSAGTVTVNLVDVETGWASRNETSRVVNISVTAHDAANDDYAGVTSIPVTVNRLEVADAAIQVLDFTSALESSTDVAIESTKPVATAAAATLTSVVFDQEAGQEYWTKATPEIVLRAKNRVADVNLSGLTAYTTDADLLASTSLVIVDDANTAKTFTVTAAPAETLEAGATAASWETLSGGTMPAWIAKISDSPGWILNINHSEDGQYAVAYTYTTKYRWTICKLDVPYNMMGDGTIISERAFDASPLPSTTSNSKTVQQTSIAGPFNISDDGTRLYHRQYWVTSATNAWLIEFTLSTPYDLSTLTIGHGESIPVYSALYDENNYGSGVIVKGDASQIICSLCDNYDTIGYMDVWDMSTPGDLSTATRTNVATDANYTFGLGNISPDKTYVTVYRRFDDGANANYNYRWRLTTPGDYTTLIEETSVGHAIVTTTESSGWGVCYDPVDHDMLMFGFVWQYIRRSNYSNLNADVWVYGPSYVTLSGNTINGTVDVVTLNDVTGDPDFHLDDSIGPAVPNTANTALTINTDTGWAFDGTNLERTINYGEQATDGDKLQFKLAALDIDTIVHSVNIDLVRS